ncbi:hypothetical protein RAN53_09590 [Halomonas sp. SSL-5]|uniref:hypothetical protein n=1 Tax=Halomonas sp. SSL-5 TaxID=3065855 RepID=UPI0027383151|nr:hypothetical protein [Halomonas sp. SSL-5]MDY7116602.1 hypothetical protein [Halomonas sp. SSL-5]
MTLESAVQQYEQTNAKLVEEVVDLKSSYRASAAAANNLYETVSAGLSATGTGEYFSVPGDGNYLTIYKNASGTAEAVATYPKADAVEQAGLDATSVAADRTAVEASATQVASDAADATAAKTAAEAARDDAVNIAGGDSQPIFDAWVVDVERRKIENATGGACTLERTAGGEPCYMFVIPKMKWEDLVPSGELGTGVHEAFLQGGVEKSELLVGMYLASTVNGELVSQAKKVPRRSINWDNSRTEAQAAGFDIMSTWEWSAIAFWCLANGFQPRGNTSRGQSHSHPHEQGLNVEYDNTATGSGPNSWSHNNAANGIADLVGNLWEWQWGLKLVDGRAFLAADNDKSLVESSWVDTGWDMPSASSSNWANFYNSENEAPLDVRRALIMPNGVADPDGSMWTTLTGERFPFRGGYRSDGGNAGLGALALYHERTNAGNTFGLRLSRLV